MQHKQTTHTNRANRQTKTCIKTILRWEKFINNTNLYLMESFTNEILRWWNILSIYLNCIVRGAENKFLFVMFACVVCLYCLTVCSICMCCSFVLFACVVCLRNLSVMPVCVAYLRYLLHCLFMLCACVTRL